MIRVLQPPSTIAFNLIDPKLYAALRRQRPDLPAIYKPNRSGYCHLAKTLFCASIILRLLFVITMFDLMRDWTV